MPNPTLRALLERAAIDAGFRARLLAHPALAGSLSGAQAQALLDEMTALDGQLTDEMLEGAAGGISHTGRKDDIAPACNNHNEAGLRIAIR